MLAFYLRPDVQTVMAEYEADLSHLYEKVVGAAGPLDRDVKRMTREGYVRGFGETMSLVPDVFVQSDLEHIFQTIVNERVDTGVSNLNYEEESAFEQRMAGSLSYEEFKKSMVRIASLCMVITQRVKIGP